MPTPRFKNLNSQQALEVVNAFLGLDSKVTFTEKLAGQNLVVIVRPNGEVIATTKSANRIAAGMFPEITGQIEKFHPPVKSDIKYTFEIIRSSKRPDFIDYKFDTSFVAVEFGGNMQKDVADLLNKRQNIVKFYTTEDIKKSVKNVIKPHQKEYLQSTRNKLIGGIELTPQEKSSVEEMLMDIVDSEEFVSSIGGKRIEGLFGKSSEVGFKIPSKKYAEIQKLQAGLYGSVKNTGKREFVSRFQDNDPKGDRLMSDVKKYLEKISEMELTPGFRFFFSPAEAQQLLSLDMEELGKRFYDRVRSKEWVTGQSTNTQIKSEIKKTNNTNLLLKEFIRGFLGLPQVQ